MPIEGTTGPVHGCRRGARLPGTTQRLAELAGDRPPSSIAEVLERLSAIAEHAGATSMLGEQDGIATFTRLYRSVTATIGMLAEDGKFTAPEFLERLDLEFATRYFDALRRYAVDVAGTPAAWRVLFDHRADPAVPTASFAVVGINAHLNYDLAGAIVSTWERVAPDEGGPDSHQYLDYCTVNDVFETAMDPLLTELGPPAGPRRSGEPDRSAQHLADLVLRFTRDLAWDEAREVWTDGADPHRRRASERKLDTIAAVLGARLLSG